MIHQNYVVFLILGISLFFSSSGYTDEGSLLVAPPGLQESKTPPPKNPMSKEPSLEGKTKDESEPRFESYLDRPNILEMKSQEIPSLDPVWPHMKRAHLEGVAQLLEMYPEHQIYFLARDSELLYDFAKIMTKNNPKDSARTHLLNISRANMSQPGIQEYLSQEGINEAALESGKKILFVDTGFAGTIPRKISEYFPEQLRSQLQTQLMVSSNTAHPSSRTFLTALNPAAASIAPSSMHGTIVQYEYMPRYTDRSNRFDLLHEKWNPMSSTESSSDGKVNKEEAIRYMEDLLDYAKKSEVQQLFNKRRDLWRKLERSRRHGKAKNLETLETLLHSKDPYAEAIVRDFIEITKTNFSRETPHIPQLSELNLEEIVDTHSFQSNKFDLISKHPEWKAILEDPQEGIKSLIHKKDFHTLRSILDAIVDHEFIQLAVENLIALDPNSKDLQKEVSATLQSLIDKTSSAPDSPLALHTQVLINSGFKNKNSAHLSNVLKKLILKGNHNILFDLHPIFLMDHAKNWENETKFFKKEIENLIKNANFQTLGKYGVLLGQKEYDGWNSERKGILDRVHTILKDQSDHPEGHELLGILSQDYARRFINEEKNAKKLISSSLKPLEPKNADLIISLMSREVASDWHSEQKLLSEELSSLISETNDFKLVAKIAKALAEAKMPFLAKPLAEVRSKIQEVFQSGDSFAASYLFPIFSGPGAPEWEKELAEVLNSGLYRIDHLANSVFKPGASQSWVGGEKLVSKHLDPFLETAAIQDVVQTLPLFKVNESKGIQKKKSILRDRVHHWLDQPEESNLTLVAEILSELPEAKDWQKEQAALRSKFSSSLKAKDATLKTLVPVLKIFRDSKSWDAERALYKNVLRKQIENAKISDLTRLSSLFLDESRAGIDLNDELTSYRDQFRKFLEKANTLAAIKKLSVILSDPIYTFSKSWVDEKEILSERISHLINHLKSPQEVCEILPLLENQDPHNAVKQKELLQIQVKILIPQMKQDRDFLCFEKILAKPFASQWNEERSLFRNSLKNHFTAGHVGRVDEILTLFHSPQVYPGWKEELQLFRKFLGTKLRQASSLQELNTLNMPLSQEFAKNWFEEREISKDRLLELIPEHSGLAELNLLLYIYQFKPSKELEPILEILQKAIKISDDLLRKKSLVEMISQLKKKVALKLPQPVILPVSECEGDEPPLSPNSLIPILRSIQGAGETEGESKGTSK